ncbi:hypothetical protein Mgra_00008752 [Meloidogyne graminicola]|uniref:Nodule Cysteine-Rich (NCR) secreted peptide n=1 Tax=Meloidogyne graminicola TaxID=189291 RepID=A0A8S9ZEU9_9BILA|nr:hypothetical protein Mgra_00008752 [Meloidogyne graminicola]
MYLFFNLKIFILLFFIISINSTPVNKIVMKEPRKICDKIHQCPFGMKCMAGYCK